MIMKKALPFARLIEVPQGLIDSDADGIFENLKVIWDNVQNKPELGGSELPAPDFDSNWKVVPVSGTSTIYHNFGSYPRIIQVFWKSSGTTSLWDINIPAGIRIQVTDQFFKVFCNDTWGLVPTGGGYIRILAWK